MKTYKDALNAVKLLLEINPSDAGIKKWAQDNFPELKADRDVEIADALIGLFEDDSSYISEDVTPSEALAWVTKRRMLKPTLANGVYIVYKNGLYERYSKDCSIKDIAFIGVAHEGHTFGLPLDCLYKKNRLLVKDEYPVDSHCVSEVDALLNWDFVGETRYLQGLGLSFQLKEGHYIPTMPVFTALYAYRDDLNDVLKRVDRTQIDFKSDFWFAQRYGISSAWVFGGSGRMLSYNYTNVYGAYQVVAVALWEPD